MVRAVPTTRHFSSTRLSRSGVELLLKREVDRQVMPPSKAQRSIWAWVPGARAVFQRRQGWSAGTPSTRDQPLRENRSQAAM
jgi:hypothetical protein